MKFRTFYLISIGLLVVPAALLLLGGQRLIYILYGFDPNLIGGSELEAFSAFEATCSARKFAGYFLTGSALICLITSGFALKFRVFTRYFVAHVIFGLSLIALLILIIAQGAPTRAF